MIKVSKEIQIFIVSVIFVRFVFWLGGMDIFERGVDSAMALFFSMVIGGMVVAFKNELL